MSRRLKLKPVFDERTGDPGRDAIARRDNKKLRRIARDLRFETSQGWQRKRYLQCVEGHRYMLCIVAAAEIAYERRHGPHAPKRPMGVEINRPGMAPVPRSRGLLSR